MNMMMAMDQDCDNFDDECLRAAPEMIMMNDDDDDDDEDFQRLNFKYEDI